MEALISVEICKRLNAILQISKPTSLLFSYNIRLKCMNFNVKLETTCNEKKNFCINCSSHFMTIRPLIRSVIVAKRFIKDLRDEKKANSVINDVLECSNLEFHELHKFEENVDRNLIFRARKGDLHIVYCVDPQFRIMFLRAIKNYVEYKKFLENKKEIKKIIQRNQ